MTDSTHQQKVKQPAPSSTRPDRSQCQTGSTKLSKETSRKKKKKKKERKKKKNEIKALIVLVGRLSLNIVWQNDLEEGIKT